MSLVLGALAIVAIGVVIMVLGAAAIAMVVRSSKGHGTSGSLSSAALEVQSLLEPEKKRAVETLRIAGESEDQDDQGGSPPDVSQSQP